MSVEIRKVEFPRDINAFIGVVFKIYAGNPYWVPPLKMDLKAFLNPNKNPYFKTATVQPFIAYRNGEAVGTIAATVDQGVQEHEPGVGLFGFFDFIDDPAVSEGLWKAATRWLRDQGMKSARGPANFCLNHEFGLIIDGHDDMPMIANPYNAAYYQGHYEKLDIPKARDWFTYEMDRTKSPPEIIRKIADRFMSRHPEVEIRPMKKSEFESQVDDFWELYNDAWEHNWGHSKFGREEFLWAAKRLMPVLDERLAFMAYVDGKPAAASITLLDYNQVAKKMNGSIFPFGWWHYLNAGKTIDRIRVWVLGVKQEYQKLPLGAPLYLKTWDNASEMMKLQKAEASLILEDNHRMRGALEKLGLEVAKTYRMYEAPL